MTPADAVTRPGTLRHAQRLAQAAAPASRLQPFDYVVLAICLVLIPSGVIHGLVGLDEKWVFLALAPVLVAGTLMARAAPFPQGAVALLVGLTIFSALSSFVADSYSQFLMGVSLSAAIVAGYGLCVTLEKPAALRVATWLSLLLLFGGVVGLLYSFAGGRPLLEVQVGYRRTGLYLATFSFAKMRQFIRPSGIFDEPGGFAMYLAIITMFNDILQKNRRLNLAMIFLMTLTGSLAGLILTCLYLITSNAMKTNRVKSGVVVAMVIAGALLTNFALPTNPVSMALRTFYSERVRIIDGRLVGDNRSDQVATFFQLVDDEILVRGATPAGRRYAQDLTSNPFSITFAYGLLISLPYFALLIWLAMITIRNRFSNSYTSIGTLVLLLQRPYIYNMSWSILIAAVVWVLYLTSSKRQGPRDRARAPSRLHRNPNQAAPLLGKP